MLDGLTVDQLRTFVAAADAGSFSAAGRSLGRAQSVVSQTLANLEAQIGIKVFDRAGCLPVLTDAGLALLGEARVVIGGMDQFKSGRQGFSRRLGAGTQCRSRCHVSNRGSHMRGLRFPSKVSEHALAALRRSARGRDPPGS